MRDASSRLRYTGLHRVRIHALRRHARQGLVPPLAHCSQLLKVAEIVLRSRGCNNGDNFEVSATSPINPALPGLCDRVILNLDGALGPNIPSFFVLGKKPDLVSLGKMSKVPTNRITDPLRLSPLKRLTRARIDYLYLAATESTHGRRYSRPDSISYDALRDSVHVVNIIDGSKAVQAASPATLRVHKLIVLDEAAGSESSLRHQSPIQLWMERLLNAGWPSIRGVLGAVSEPRIPPKGMEVE
jgi:hypothetical protein